MTENKWSVGFSGAYLKTACLVTCVLAMMLGGCYQPNPSVDRAQIESMANPEGYLLSLLKQRYASPDIHCELGRYYLRTHQLSKAQQHFDTALDFDPAHRPTQAALVKMYVDQGQTTEAQKLMRRFQRRISSSPRPLVELGQALDNEGLQDYALSCFKQALTLAPDLAPTNKYMGLHYLKNNDPTRAKQYLTRSFEINANQPDVARALGELGVTVEVPVDYGTGETAL